MSRKNLGRAIFCLLLVGTLVVLARRYWYTVTTSIPVQEDDIREAVLRQGLGEDLPNCGSQGETCCLTLDRVGDPSGAFLARFRGQFRKGSDCAWGRDGAPTEVKTGKPALIVHVGKIEWLDRFDAQIDASVLCGGLCGYGSRYLVYRQSGAWIVRRLGGWIS
jgi:hypothetical protein